MTESWLILRFCTLIPLFFPLLYSWRAKVWSSHSSETPARIIPKYLMGAFRHPMSSDVLGYRINEAYWAATVAIMTVPEEMQGSSGQSNSLDSRLPCVSPCPSLVSTFHLSHSTLPSTWRLRKPCYCKNTYSNLCFSGKKVKEKTKNGK